MSENFKPKPSGWVMKHFGITRGKLDKYDELIAPETRSDQQFNKNKYREYRYEDIEQMWYIHMLSQMGMQMKEIKELVGQDEIVFRNAVIQRIEDLEAEKRRIEGMISIAKMCRVTGRIPLPKDFASIPFADYREAVLQKWSSNNSSESKLMMALADYQLENQSPTSHAEELLSKMTDDDFEAFQRINLLSIVKIVALEDQLAHLYPQEVSSSEVMAVVAEYCECLHSIYGDSEYTVKRIADHTSSQFYDGDKSVEILNRYGKEKQEYMASAFEYFAKKD